MSKQTASPARTIKVSRHAIIQFLRRHPDFKTPPKTSLERWIIQQVDEATGKTRVYDRKPKAWRLYHEGRRNGLLGNQRVVTTADDNYGWIIAYEPNGDIIVVTSLLKPTIQREPS